MSKSTCRVCHHSPICPTCGYCRTHCQCNAGAVEMRAAARKPVTLPHFRDQGRHNPSRVNHR
jgi:hypothetical protein